MNVTHLTQQRKSLSGKQLVSLSLKRSANWTPTSGPPSCLSVCLQSPSSSVPCTHLCYHPLSFPLSCLPLIMQASCQWWASRQAEWGQSFDEDPDTTDMAGGSFEERGPYMYPSIYAHTCTHKLACACRVLRWRNEEKQIGGRRRELLPLTDFLDGFNEGIWILLLSCA